MACNPARLEIAADAESARAFRHPGDVLDAEVQMTLVEQLADVLTPVLLYISRGRLGGTMGHRVWVVLHETRLDLIGGESIEKYAARVGIDSKRVRVLIAEFRDAVPGYRSGSQRSADSVERMRDGHRRRGGAGKESFSSGGPSSGSATTRPSTREGREK